MPRQPRARWADRGAAGRQRHECHPFQKAFAPLPPLPLLFFVKNGVLAAGGSYPFTQRLAQGGRIEGRLAGNAMNAIRSKKPLRHLPLFPFCFSGIFPSTTL